MYWEKCHKTIFQWELCQPRPVADLRLWQGPGTCVVRETQSLMCSFRVGGGGWSWTKVSRKKKNCRVSGYITGWWFQTFFIFTPIRGEMIPIVTSIFFKGVETTNQMILCLFFGGFLQVILHLTQPTSANFLENFMARVGRCVFSAFIQFIRLKAPKTAIGVCDVHTRFGRFSWCHWFKGRKLIKS